MTAKKKPSPEDLSHILPALRPHAVRISTLNLDPENALDHEERDLRATETSLAEFQQHRVAVVQKDGRRVRVGNGMVEALQRGGKEWVAAIIVDEDDLRASARAIADNRTGRLAPWNSNLAKVLARLAEEDESLATATGFSEEEIAELIDGMGDPDGGDSPGGGDPPDENYVTFVFGEVSGLVARETYDRFYKVWKDSEEPTLDDHLGDLF